MQPRRAALYFFASILATGLATGAMMALVLMRFMSGSLLAAMGEACGGIFEASHGFLAESRLNYLLAVAVAAVLFSQLAFLLGGGTRLFKASNRLKKIRGRFGMSCPALAEITQESWADHTYFVPDGLMEAQTIGLIRPRIMIHSGMVESLTTDELLAVAAHEEAHRTGNDNLLSAAAKAVSLTLFYHPGARMAYREMCRCLELAADRKASYTTGGPLFVASALARIVTLSRSSEPAAVMSSSLSGNSLRDITSRLEYLTRDDKKSRRSAGLTLLFACVVTAILLAFAGSAFAVTDTDQRGALVCFTEHAQESVSEGVCTVDHENHT